MRISTSQIYSQTLNNINNSLARTIELTNQTATQKKLNAPSDDPAGMGNVMTLQTYDKSLEKYQENTNTAAALLATADGILMQGSEVMTSVMEQAEQASTGTYSDAQSQMMAENMMGYQDSMLGIANSKSGDDYLFSGEAIDTSPYEYVPGVTALSDSPAKTDFASFTGEVGDPVLVEFTSDGTVGTDSVDYRYSLDGGTTWTAGTMDGTATPSDTTMELGDVSVEVNSGVAVTAYDEEADSGSRFVVRNSLAYNGADKAQSVAVSESSELAVNTVGSDAFGGVDPDTGLAYEDPNLFESMSDAIAYMWVGDEDSVASTLETLRDGHEQMTAVTADVGAREQKAEFTGNSITFSQERVAAAISSEEDANAAQLTIEMSQANYVYEAVLNTSSQIMNQSILDYI